MGINSWFIILFAQLFSQIYADESCLISSYDEVETVVKNCTDIKIGDLVVPAGKTLNFQLQDNTTVTVSGTVSFEYGGEWYGPLVQINGTGITFDATMGTFDGNGSKYWDGQGGWGTAKPQFFQIQAYRSAFHGFLVQNAPQGFFYLSDSDYITFDNCQLNNLRASALGHNTDGFVVFNSSNVYIADSNVYNQDDCVALQSGENITVSHLFCYGGHGLSISVGHSNDSYKLNTLKNVTFRHCSVTSGENAIHIKTHVDGGKGIISDITYRDIKFEGQENYGINIGQNYQNQPPGSHQPAEARGNIPIEGLEFSTITGDFAYNKACVPVYINCAEGACTDWEWFQVSVKSDYKQNQCNYQPKGFTC